LILNFLQILTVIYVLHWGFFRYVVTGNIFWTFVYKLMMVWTNIFVHNFQIIPSQRYNNHFYCAFIVQNGPIIKSLAIFFTQFFYIYRLRIRHTINRFSFLLWVHLFVIISKVSNLRASLDFFFFLDFQILCF
jgi:hypothetical protein